MPEQGKGGFPSRRLPVLVLLAFLVFILAEVAMLVFVSTQIGWWTLAALMVSTVLGAYLLQREWRKAWKHLSQSMNTGSLPAGRTADAVLVLLGGFMLIMPGFITDILGLLLLLPFTRPAIRTFLGWWASRIIPVDVESPRSTVIRGEVVEEDSGSAETAKDFRVIPHVEDDDS